MALFIARDRTDGLLDVSLDLIDSSCAFVPVQHDLLRAPMVDAYASERRPFTIPRTNSTSATTSSTCTNALIV